MVYCKLISRMYVVEKRRPMASLCFPSGGLSVLVTSAKKMYQTMKFYFIDLFNEVLNLVACCVENRFENRWSYLLPAVNSSFFPNYEYHKIAVVDSLMPSFLWTNTDKMTMCHYILHVSSNYKYFSPGKKKKWIEFFHLHLLKSSYIKLKFNLFHYQFLILIVYLKK